MYRCTLFYFINSQNIKVFYRIFNNKTILFKNGFQLVAKLAISDLLERQRQKQLSCRTRNKIQKIHRLSKVSYDNDPLPKKIKKQIRMPTSIRKGRFNIRLW